ncbi:MAG: DUF2252 family protein [Bacteroidota bacterium]|nr:DUF2252 family protein [Bacteroidota bacterium]MDP4215321.1 DUF2252 family protein [Bacteroidota bacterium]MDP4245010.1 DUF2252 family protein [Bacteroidota bacterium]MDP4252884.1 DUF2252 family protein [Bacteroidota bacterium]MDP4259127.1 DUF2252 family protein [Bacteroidota bacterium]
MASIPERIRQFNNPRVPAYTALKYDMMAENAFRFLRGTSHLFYEDLSGSNALSASPLSWISGDLHLENFGTYKGDNRLVYFDLNDFDEGILAPSAWELVRMVTSIFTGFESLGIRRKDIMAAAELFLQTYSANLGGGKAHYIEPETAKGIVSLFIDKVCERKQKELVRQRTVLKNERLALRIDKTRLFPVDKALKKELTGHLAQWIRQDPHLQNRHRVLDTGFRIAGTGSLGVKRYVFLTRNLKDPKKHLLIDMKQSLPSALQPFVTARQPAWSSEAERVVAVQKRMQNISPALLSTTTFKGDHYVLKELQPTSDKIDFMVIRDRQKDIDRVIKDMAMLTASAQLRSSGRQGSAIADELIEFGADTSWQKGLLEYAAEYAGQVQRDYREYFSAYKAGFFKNKRG